MLYAYFNTDGSVKAITSMPSDYPDEDVLERMVPLGSNANEIYFDFDTSTVVAKQSFEPSISYNRVSSLPTGTTITTSDTQFLIEDGEIEFEADTLADFTIFLSHPQYLGQYIIVPTGPELT